MNAQRPRAARATLHGALLFCLLLSPACQRNELPPPPPSSPQAKLVDDTTRFRAETVGAPVSSEPWITHVVAVDLDRDGRMDFLVCEAKDSTLSWMHQQPDGSFTEEIIAKDLRCPVHAEAVDLDGDGDLDILVACMGFLFPNNDRIGSVIALENDGHEHFTPHVLLENVARVTDVRAADFNGDGKLDLVVGQFGYDQGEIRWMERTGPWSFVSHNLLDLSGTINVCVADMNGNHRPDIVAVVSQQWEEIYLFTNEGAGVFSKKIIFGSTNEDYASSGISLCDVNRDGRMDVLYTNGDGFGPAAVAGPRPWHGVQWLENNGGGFFTYHRIGNLAGAYCPIGADVDGDGAIDVLAISGFNDWERKFPRPVSLVWFHNDGRMNFDQRVLAYEPTHLISFDAADIDKSGRVSIMAGAFFGNPPYKDMTRLTLWRPRKTP